MRDPPADYPEDCELSVVYGNGMGWLKTTLAGIGAAIIIAQLTWIGFTVVTQGQDIATLKAQMAFVVEAVRK